MLAIDTLKLSEDLKEGGFDEKQTTTLVDLGRTLSDQALEKVATKEDLKALEDRMDTKLETLEERIGDKLEAQEERMDLKFDGLRKDVTGEIGGLRKDVTGEIGGLRKDVTGEMKLLEQRMNGKFETLEQRMVIKLGGMLAVGIGILVMFDRLFPAAPAGG